MLQHVKPSVLVIMNIYGNCYWKVSTLTTSSNFKFCSMKNRSEIIQGLIMTVNMMINRNNIHCSIFPIINYINKEERRRNNIRDCNTFVLCCQFVILVLLSVDVKFRSYLYDGCVCSELRSAEIQNTFHTELNNMFIKLLLILKDVIEPVKSAVQLMPALVTTSERSRWITCPSAARESKTGC